MKNLNKSYSQINHLSVTLFHYFYQKQQGFSLHMKILLKNATIIDSSNSLHCKSVSILIENGFITKIEKNINTKADVLIDNKNMHVSRGWWDPSVSFGEPGYEERETLENGLTTAAKSGFTSIGLNPDLNPVTDNHGAVNFLINKCKGHTTSIYPNGCLTESSLGKQMASLNVLH